MAKQGMKRPEDNEKNNKKSNISPVPEIHNKKNTTLNTKSTTKNQYR